MAVDAQERIKDLERLSVDIRDLTNNPRFETATGVPKQYALGVSDGMSVGYFPGSLDGYDAIGVLYSCYLAYRTSDSSSVPDKETAAWVDKCSKIAEDGLDGLHRDNPDENAQAYFLMGMAKAFKEVRIYLEQPMLRQSPKQTVETLIITMKVARKIAMISESKNGDNHD